MIRVPPYPFDFARNRAYQHLMETYQTQWTWDLRALKRLGGSDFADQIVAAGFLCVSRSEHCRLSFNVTGTVPSLVILEVAEQVRSMEDVRNSIGEVRRPTKAAFKHLISFLDNFNQVQCFTDPITAMTVLGDVGPNGERLFDQLYQDTELMGKFLYRPEQEFSNFTRADYEATS